MSNADVKALFIGNSYTHFNNMPILVANVLRALPDAPSSVSTSMFVWDGATVAELLSMSESQDRIRNGNFTHVVIQGQSYEALIDFRNFSDSATQFVAAINASGAAPVLFETWAREARSTDYEMSWSGGTPAAMHAGLRRAYMRVAQSAGATMAPVGDAFARCVSLWPNINLYDTDLAHPSLLGSSLAALVFANTFTGQSTTGSLSSLPYSLGIDDDDGAKLQAVADCVCDELRGKSTSCNKPIQSTSSSGSTKTTKTTSTLLLLSTSSSSSIVFNSTAPISGTSASARDFTWLIVLLVFAIALALVSGLVYFKYRSRVGARSRHRSDDESSGQAALIDE
jgi:hypothetical protein